MKEFEQDYAAFEEIDSAYDKSLSEEEKEKIRADYKVWADGIEAKGKKYAGAFRLYKEARDNGNSRIDINNANNVEAAVELVNSMKDFGITEFTYSSTWSSALEASWAFIQNGWELAGMVEVYTGHTKPFSEEKETTPAYLFRAA